MSQNRGGNTTSNDKRNLLLHSLISSFISSTSGLATESTLQSVLTSIKAHQDFEIKLVRDTGNSDKVVCEVIEYDEETDTYSYSYKDVGGSPYTPTGPLEYLDPEAVLNLVLAELITLNSTDFSTETTLSSLLTAFNSEDFASETTLAQLLSDFNSEDFSTETTLAALLTAFNSEDFATETTLAALAATDFATETTLADVKTALELIDDSVGTEGTAHGASQKGLRALGTDGTNDKQLKTNASGELETSVTSSALPTGAATEATLASLEAKLNSLGQKASASSVPVVLSTEQEVILDAIKTAVEAIDLDADGLATEVTLSSIETLLTTIDTVLDNILVDTTAIASDTSTLATPLSGLTAAGPTRATGAGTVTAGKRRISIFNAGTSNGTVNGATIKPGESFTWASDGVRDTLGTVSYDGTGTELVIITVG